MWRLPHAGTGPFLWIFLATLGVATASTITCGLCRMHRAHRRRLNHGHWRPKAQGAYELPADRESDDEDVFTWLTSGIVV